MIADTNAVVDPLAVMVISLNTLVTGITVTRVCRAYNFTVRAQKICLEFFDKAHEWNS